MEEANELFDAAEKGRYYMCKHAVLDHHIAPAHGLYGACAGGRYRVANAMIRLGAPFDVQAREYLQQRTDRAVDRHLILADFGGEEEDRYRDAFDRAMLISAALPDMYVRSLVLKIFIQ